MTPIDESPTGLAAEVAELRAELERVRDELGALRSAIDARSNPASHTADDRSSRRVLLRRGAFALGAGVASAGLVARPVTAADGDVVKVGASHSGVGSTKVTSSGPGADALYGESTATGGQSWGVRGSSNSPVGIGVSGSNGAITGAAIGVRGTAASSEGVGVKGTSSSSSGTGVVGVCQGSGAGAGHGVSGTTLSRHGSGVNGFQDHLLGFGSGVTGTASSPLGFGVTAQNINGPGLLAAGSGSRGVGGEFRGDLAAANFGASGAAPPTTVDEHLAGDVVHDAANDLWFCTKSGTPGTWFKLTAAGLSPVAPFRVYDSRFVDGPLLRGSNRLVSVRDSIDVVSGAVVKKNAVAVGARAVLFNVAVTNTVGAGFVAAAPGNASKVTAASINWSGSGETLNNGTFSQLDGNRRLRVFADGTPGSRTDVIIDVTGIVLA